MDATRTSSPCLDTKVLTLENDIFNSKIYLKLGLKGRTNQNHENPKVLSLLSSHLQKHVEKNEKLLLATQTKDVPTVFHGSRAPTLTIQQYIDRIFKYSRCSPSCFVVAHIYIDRLIQSENIILTSLNVHRLLITSIMLATKFIDEAFFNNAYYAKVGGITRAEMNRLEMKFLFGIDFRLYVNHSTFEKYCLELMSEGSEEVQKERLVHGSYGIIVNRSKNKDDSTNPTIEIHIE
ncbi:hypothetical protein L1987_21881 [Smallanthus sonchifolius]|uniref:Uncharacterized protein n=1 Tax=Smallanthus sonchifolius TaxID=185202 RepID=A0ACB9IE98_9ASTR|nr:hypothetical protein L1987_21881 [Smallanthus sonchifolius]